MITCVLTVCAFLLSLGLLMTGFISSLLRNTDYRQMNTVGYINDGSNCFLYCSVNINGGICGAVGSINISFYPPETFNPNAFADPTNLVYQQITVPPICSGYFDEEQICCRDYIEKNQRFWFDVQIKEGEYRVEHVSLTETLDVKLFWSIGILSYIGSFFCSCCGGCLSYRGQKSSQK